MTALLTSLLAFFTFGAMGFWILVLGLSIIYTIAVENEKHGLAIATTIGAIILGWNNLNLLFHNWQLFLIGIGAYGIIGGMWMVWRYRRFCKDYLDQERYRDISDAEKYEFIEHRLKSELDPQMYKSKCISWIVYWPWSLTWNFLGDFFVSIYETCSNVLIRIRDNAVQTKMNSMLKETKKGLKNQ